MACNLVIKDKHIQSVLGQSEFESIDSFQEVFYNKFVLNPSAIPVKTAGGITFLRLSQNEDQSISVQLRTNTDLKLENYNLELPEDTVRIEDYTAVIPPTFNENGNPVADLDTFMYLWLGNYYYPDIDKLNNLFEKVIPEVLRSFATKLVYEEQDRLQKKEVIPSESRNFVESLIGEKGLINYYSSILETHYKSDPTFLKNLEKIKEKIAQYTQIIDKFSPIEEKPLEKKYANYTMINTGEDLSPEEAEIAKDLKETEEKPVAEKNTTVVKSFSKPTATFDSDTIDNAEVGKSILMSLVNSDPRQFRAVVSTDDPSFVQNKIVVNNQITSLKTGQVNTKTPSVLIIEVKEGDTWKKVYLKKNTSELVKTSDLAKLDSFSLTTDPAEAYQFSYELEENNEIKTFKSPQLTLRSEQLSAINKDPQKKSSLLDIYNTTKSKGLSLFHSILKGSKAITRNYLSLKVRGFSINDITIKATGPYRGIPQINGEYIDTGVLPEDIKQEVKDLLNFSYPSERDAIEVIKYLNALIGVGDFTPIESTDTTGTNRINITRRTIGFFPDIVNGKYVIKSIVYRYKDEGKFHFNSTKEKLDFLIYGGDSKALIDKSLDAARLQIPKVPFVKGTKEPHEIVGEYPTRYAIKDGALQIVEWPVEEQHEFILENSKTHLTKSGETIANFDQILYVSTLAKESELAKEATEKQPTEQTAPQPSDKEGTLVNLKEIAKGFTDIQKLFKSLFDKKAKDTIIVLKSLPNSRANIKVKNDNSNFTQEELDNEGVKISLKKGQKVNKIIFVDTNSFETSLTGDETQISLTNQAIVEEMIHALTYDKVTSEEVVNSEEYSRIFNAITQLQNSVNLDQLTEEQRKYFEYYVGVKGEEITPTQVLEFLASTQIEVLRPVFESANIEYPKAEYSSLYEYLESLFNSLKKFLSDLLLKDSPSLQERITADTISIILDKVTKKDALVETPVEPVISISDYNVTPPVSEETVKVSSLEPTEELDEVEKIVAEVGSQPETSPVSVDGEKPAAEKGVESAPSTKGKVTVGLSRKFNKKSDTELYTLIDVVKPKFSDLEKTEIAFEDLAVRKSAANHLDMVAAEYLFFEREYSSFIFNKISIQELVELGRDILQRELDDPEITKERKNFVQYLYNNIETIWVENSTLLAIIDKELREEYFPEAESDTTIDGEVKIGQDANDSESNGGDSTSKFEERTEQKKSVLETIGVYAEHFVRMIPRIKTIDGVPQYESFEEDGITFTSPEYLRDSYGNLVPADYTTTWNSIADIVKGSLTVEEMILVLESSFLKVPEVAIFLDRLKKIGTTREDTLLLKNLEKSLQKVFIPTEVMVQEDLGKKIGRHFSIFAQGRLDLINIQNILSSRFREKFSNFIVGLEVDYIKLNEYLKKNTGVSGAERFVSPDNYKQIVDFWVNHGINIPAKLPENLRIKLEKNLATFTFELIAKFNELEKNKISNAVADIKGFDLFSFVAKGNLLNGAAVRSNSFAKNAVLTSLADVLPYSTSNMTKNAEGENQSNLHNFSSFLIYIKYINNLYKNGAAFRDKIVGAIPRLKNPIAKYSWVLDKVRAGATVTPINLSGVQYTNKGTNTINLDLIPYLQFQMQSLLLNNTKENLRAETASTSFGFRIDNSKEKLPISKSVLQSMRPIFESYLRGEIERITKEKKSDYKYFSKYNNKKDKFTFLDSVLSDSTKEKIYEIINNNLDKDDAEIWSLVLPLRQEYVNDFSAYKVKVRANFEKFILEETGLELNIEHPIFNNESLKEHVNTLGFNDAIDMFLMNGVVLGIEEIILFHGEIGQFDKFYKRSKSTISNGTPVVVSKNLRTLLQTTLQGYTFSEIIGGQRPEYYSDPTQLKTSTFSDDLMLLADDQRDNLEKGIENSLKLSSAAFGKPFNKKEAEEFANNTVDQYDNANIGDGQGWIHPDAYRMILMGVDSWSPEREEGFIYLAIKEKKRRGFPLEEKDVQKLKEVEDKIKTKGYYFQFPDIKFQYRGGSVLTITVDGKEEDVEAPTAIEVLDKFALAPLFPEFAQNSIAEKMLENMTKNNVAYTKFESATKIGGFEKNNLNDLLSDNFKFKGVHKITTVFLKEQVKTPNKIKEQDSLGTQKRKLLISNLSIDGEFLEEMKPFYNMWKGNQRALADKARKDLYEDLGIDPKAFEDPYAKINIDVNKLVALLRKEVDKRDLPKPLRAFFDKDFEPKDMVFFEQSLSPKIVENMLYSMLKNRIVKAKFPGSQLIQISSSLFNRTTNLNENGRDLEFYRYDEQTGEILPAQAKVTLHGPFLNLLNLPEVKQAGGTLEALNTLLRDPEFRKKHKNVITVVSYRIPTQGYNSMDILEIVEFLPGYLGNTIVPPPQITVKSGTDFDYDKMPTIYPNIDKDGNYIYTDNVDMNVYKMSKEDYKKRISELNSKIEAERTKLKEQNTQAFEEAQVILNKPGDVSASTLSPKELRSLKVFKGNLYEEIEKYKNEVDELKESLKELKPYLDKNQPMSSRKKAYKQEFGKDMNLTKLLEKRQKIQDSLKVRIEDINKRYTILNKLKGIKEEVNASLNTLVEERNKLKRSRKVEAVYVNGLIEAAKGILLHPMNFHRLITPNNVSIVTDKIQSILEKIYGTKNVNPEPVNSDIFDYTTHLKKWLAVKIKDLLGITAVNNTFFSLMQEANFSFNNTININDSSFDFKTPLLTKEERKEARVTNPFLADSGIEKLEILNQFINLFVDAASNDIAGYTNLIRDNVGFVILQNDLGVPFDRTLALIHQPIIYRYNQIVKENTGKGLSKAQAEKIAINALLDVTTSIDGFPIKSSKVWAQIKEKYDENIGLISIKNLEKSVVTKDNINNFENNPFQQAALLYYIVGIKQAEALREAQSNVNYDTSPIQSYKRSVVRENIINSIEKTGFVSKFAMRQIKNGVIGHLNIHNELKFLSEKLFPIKADPDFVNFAAPLFEKIPTNKLDEFITTFDNDFLMYVIQNFSINFNQERYEYIKSLMSNGSLMIRWNKLIAKYKLEETRLAQKLYPVTQGYGGANPAIFMGLDNDSEEFNAIEEEIRSYANPVGNSPREIELKAFANDLMDLGFFQTGYNTGRLYMLKVLPAEYTEQFKDAFENFYKLTREEKQREYVKFLGAFEAQRFDGIAAPLVSPEDQMMMATYFGTTSDILINYLEETSIAQEKGYNSSTTPKRGLTAITEVVAPIENITRLGTSTTFTIYDNTVKKEVTKTGITLSIQGHPNVKIYATKEISTEKSEVGSTKFNTVTDKVYLNIEHATLGSVVVSDVNAKDLTELLNSFKTKVNKSLSKTAIGISTLKELGFTITDTSKPQQQQQPVVVPGKQTVINIYAGTNENAELSNFAIRPFTTNVETPSGKKQFTFQSVEQGFHFYKTIVANRPDIGKKVLETTNGATLKSLTNRSNLPMTPEQIEEWDSTSKSVMLNLMYDSFLENPEAAKKLLNTGNATLTHKFNGKEQDNGRFSEVITIVRDMLRESNSQKQQFSQKNIFTVNPKQSADKKAKAKASIATQFIGFAEGIEGSSTALYASQVGQYANTGNYSSSDVIFVSIGGKRGDITIRKQQQDKTIIEAIKALEAGATLITDNAAYVESSDYNEGEKRLAANLKAKGYFYSETTVDGNLLGVWKKQQQPSRKTYSGKIEKLEPNQIFVFGSNIGSSKGGKPTHGGGSAKLAKEKFGAIQGQPRGLQGQSYAIVTKKYYDVERSSTPAEIIEELKGLYTFATQNSDKEFLVSDYSKSNLNGYTGLEMAKMFVDAGTIPSNVVLSVDFQKQVDSVSPVLQQPSTQGEINNTPTPIKGLNERLDSYGYSELVLSPDFYKGEKPKVELSGFKNLFAILRENITRLADINWNTFDFILSKKDIEKLNSLKSIAEELDTINTLKINDNTTRTVDVEKRYAYLSNKLVNDFVDIISVYVEQQLGKTITSSKPRIITKAPVQTETQPTQKTDLGKINPTLDLSKTWKGDLESRPVYTSEGVNTMRTDAANPNEHFGNPFSATGYEGTRKVPDVKTAIRAYKEWLLTGYTSWLNEEGEAQDFAGAAEQRAWILDQINQGKLDTANLLYDKKLAERGQGTHAGALIEVVKELRGSQPATKTLGTLTPTAPVKPGVEELFEENKELAAIGTPSQYSSYLDTVFPDSKVKDIVYHGSKYGSLDIKNIKDYRPSIEINRVGLFFSERKDIAKVYSKEVEKTKTIEEIEQENEMIKGLDKEEREWYFRSKSNMKKEKLPVFSAIINLSNPKQISLLEWDNIIARQKHGKPIDGKNLKDSLKLENYNSIKILSFLEGFEKFKNKEEFMAYRDKKGFYNLPQSIQDKYFEEYREVDKNIADYYANQYAVFEPEQIHILGSKSDIEGFKEYVRKETQPEESLFNSSFTVERQKEIVSNFALKHKMSEEQAIEYINQAVAQKGQQAIDKLKECY